MQLLPLRERREDIPYLTARFVRDCAERLKRPITGVAPAAERLLQQAPWPGNIRELRNVIERACIVSENRILSERDFLAALAPQRAALEKIEAPPLALAPTAHDPVEDAQLSNAQRDHIARVLHQARGNKAAAAKLLGISRRSLYRWIDRLHVSQ